MEIILPRTIADITFIMDCGQIFGHKKIISKSKHSRLMVEERCGTIRLEKKKEMMEF